MGVEVRQDSRNVGGNGPRQDAPPLRLRSPSHLSRRERAEQSSQAALATATRPDIIFVARPLDNVRQIYNFSSPPRNHYSDHILFPSLGDLDLIKADRQRTQFIVVGEPSSLESQIARESHAPTLPSVAEMKDWLAGLPKETSAVLKSALIGVEKLYDQAGIQLSEELLYGGLLTQFLARRLKKVGVVVGKSTVQASKALFSELIEVAKGERGGAIEIKPEDLEALVTNVKSTTKNIRQGAVYVRQNPGRVAWEMGKAGLELSLAWQIASCGPPPTPQFKVEPIPASAPFPAYTVVPDDPGHRVAIPTPGSVDRHDSNQTPTINLSADKITPEASKNIEDFLTSLNAFMNDKFDKTKGQGGGFPILKYVDARKSQSNPTLFAIFSDQKGITIKPGPDNSPFRLNGNLYMVVRDANGNGRIFPIQAPDDYTVSYLNFDTSTLNFYDGDGNILKQVKFTATSVGPAVAVAPAVDTPTPPQTVAPSPTVTEMPKIIRPEIRVSPDHRLVNEKGEVLKGSVLIHFLNEYIPDSTRPQDKTRFDQAKRGVNTIKAQGVNAVSFVLNGSMFNDPLYLEELSAILKYSKGLGISTIISFNADGLEMKNGISLPFTPHIVDSNLKSKWMKLLQNPTYGRTIIENTDAFVLIQEAGKQFSWRHDMLYYIETANAIRELSGANTPVSLSGGNYGRRYDELLTMGPAPLDGLLLNIDPYLDGTGRPGAGEEALDQIEALRNLGYTPFIGELGYKGVSTGDTLSDVDRRMEIAKSKGLAYFIWELNRWNDLQDLFKKYNPR